MLVVGSLSDLTDDVRHLRLVDPGGAALPAYAPGSHVVLECGVGPDGLPRRNAYSLTGSGVEPDSYALSVRRDDTGRGGSRWIHALSLGDSVEVSRPRSAFAPVSTARHHVLVAGGIGVTPILSHARAAVRWGRSFEVHYVFRGGDGPHLDDLINLCGNSLQTYRGSSELWSTLAPALLDRPLGTHLYTCGPAPLIDEVHDRARAAGWPPQRIHHEHFGIAALEPGTAFTVRLRSTGADVEVPSGTSLLDALEQHGVAVPNLCRQGVCGECRVPVAAGAVAHRDLYLTEDEKAAGDCVMPCVSRAEGPRLELEL
ncbi:oxidoreductase [Rhodococcus sp. ABRD24]|uniref:PDR/VanB family oxidoreductase n=1 Tax=Rhodococcus sp. ABRD24 TaxID=2507582 RepID=UPI00103FB382|nr:PDR/VanB family oxidoreductase [Rhodococcus sp. ABRD24]QBJ98605.1 oxidoreductase [Rhodococcus sp. ABRD24]